jgi:putative two-component system response regulator
LKSKKELVVLVDDSTMNLHFVKRLLGRKYTLVTMPSAVTLFPLLEKETPDLILLDIEMPVMNGFEAIEILKAKPETKDIPVIFLTSRAGETDRAKGLALGASDYITKPYAPSLLLEKIGTTLGG